MKHAAEEKSKKKIKYVSSYNACMKKGNIRYYYRIIGENFIQLAMKKTYRVSIQFNHQKVFGVKKTDFDIIRMK